MKREVILASLASEAPEESLVWQGVWERDCAPYGECSHVRAVKFVTATDLIDRGSCIGQTAACEG